MKLWRILNEFSLQSPLECNPKPKVTEAFIQCISLISVNFSEIWLAWIETHESSMSWPKICGSFGKKSKFSKSNFLWPCIEGPQKEQRWRSHLRFCCQAFSLLPKRLLFASFYVIDFLHLDCWSWGFCIYKMQANNANKVGVVLWQKWWILDNQINASASSSNQNKSFFWVSHWEANWGSFWGDSTFKNLCWDPYLQEINQASVLISVNLKTNLSHDWGRQFWWFWTW